jgi:cell division protein FtsL
MATRASHVAQQSEATKPRREARRLEVLDRRHLRARAERRQVRVLVTLSGLVLVGALVIVAAGHALLASDQVRVDSINSAVASALAKEQNLQLERAELESPSRVLAIAKTELKMVTPSSVVYLPPVNPGESVAAAHEARPSSATSSSHRVARRSRR